MRFKISPQRFAICKLPAGSSVPAWASTPGFYSITRTPDELSIICHEKSVPTGILAQTGFVSLQIEGPFDFSSIGILESFLRPLAEAGIPIFAISTYDTDYILVPDTNQERALIALHDAGHQRID